jgi:hypothetical protein
VTWDTYTSPACSARAPCLRRYRASGRGALRDGATGQPVTAKIRVTDMASGRVYIPEHAIKTMPQKAALPPPISKAKRSGCGSACAHSAQRASRRARTGCRTMPPACGRRPPGLFLINRCRSMAILDWVLKTPPFRRRNVRNREGRPKSSCRLADDQLLARPDVTESLHDATRPLNDKRRYNGLRPEAEMYGREAG